MNPFETKSIFIWNTPSIANGDPQKIAGILQSAGFQTVIFKAANGPSTFVPPIFPFTRWMRKPNVSPELVQALHDAEINVMGYGFCFGKDPVGEGTIATKLVNSLNLDGWVWDVEGSFESFSNNNPDQGCRLAKLLIDAYVKNKIRDVPLAFCSWAKWHISKQGLDRPWHNAEMGKLFMEFCDYGMPMCYWARLDSAGKPIKPLPMDAANLLAESMKQWKDVTNKPLIPVGRAYTGDGGIATGDAATAFDAYARANGIKGVSWWGLDWAKNSLDVWAALSRMPIYGAPDETPDEGNIQSAVNLG